MIWDPKVACFVYSSVASWQSKESDMINKPEPTIYLDEKIQKIVVKYGLKFIVTKNHIYIVDFEDNQLNKIDL